MCTERGRGCRVCRGIPQDRAGGLGRGAGARHCPLSVRSLQDQVSKDKALQSMASMSSAQIVSASVLQNKFRPPSPLPQAVFSSSSRVQGRLGGGPGRRERVQVWRGGDSRVCGPCPVSSVLEQPPSPGTAAWTLSGVSMCGRGGGVPPYPFSSPGSPLGFCSQSPKEFQFRSRGMVCQRDSAGVRCLPGTPTPRGSLLSTELDADMAQSPPTHPQNKRVGEGRPGAHARVARVCSAAVFLRLFSPANLGVNLTDEPGSSWLRSELTFLVWRPAGLMNSPRVGLPPSLGTVVAVV